ncbi:hypothetical protein MGSAQ_000716 [marine sediment metagenome]|uniref:Uncharacterized protein n=1 Tax=marine sediment metagenome TaxID=412755 RepID=A0A1B6NWG2_9ZZZZ
MTFIRSRMYSKAFDTQINQLLHEVQQIGIICAARVSD